MNAISADYNATLSIEEGVTDYYYEAHDEITTDNVSNAIYVGDVDNLDSAYISQGKIVINTDNTVKDDTTANKDNSVAEKKF